MKKKLIAMFIALAMCFAFAFGCTKNDDDKNGAVQLATPVVTLTGNVISWSKVDNAANYAVYEGTTVVSTQTELSYTINKTENGTYSYTVVAKSGDTTKYTDSKASTPVEYTYSNGDTAPVQLATPVVNITDNVISWSAIEHAASYDVYEGATVVSPAQTTLKYTIIKTESGTYSYSVVAKSGDTTKYTDSKPSTALEYRYTKPEVTVDTSTKLTGKIYLVGDSTVCSFTDTERYIPRYGYGTQLYNYINCEPNQIQNLAISGRSSFSFLSEDNYNTLKSSIAEGDYLIIGFGHNDQKDSIYTNPNLTSSDDSFLEGTNASDKHYASFKYTLKTFYIDVAKNAGATPILCTPIVRASTNNDYSAKNGHKPSVSDSGNYPGGDWSKAIRELATECGITCVDLTQMTADEYKDIGYTEATKYHSFSSAKYDTDGTTVIPDSVDNTHTNLYGAKMNAYRIATALLGTDNSLKAHIRTNLTKPEYDVEYPKGINAGYDVAANSTYKPFNPATDKSSRWAVTAEGWYGTAFGDVSISKCTITQIATDSFEIGTSSGGKITNGGDGFPAVFKQLDADANFEITADVTIKNYADNAQAGFGIMLRDDMFIDQGSKAALPTSNYVVAGCYGAPNSATMNFYRNKTALTSSGETGTLDTASTTVHKLSLERTGTTIIAKIDDYTYTSVADFELRAVDGNYMYLCLFATRETTVTFSNIVFTDNGTSVA